jgi:phage terminase large subunit
MDVNVRYNPKFEPLFSNTQFYKVLYGSAGSGKSYAVAQHIIKRILDPKEAGFHKVWAFRKVSTFLEESVYAQFLEVIKDFGAQGMFTYNKTQKIITCLNGSSIRCSGLDEVDKIKSAANITIVWLEEATEYEEQDINQLDLRMRGITPVYREMILTFNPISELHWLKRKFFDAPEEGVKKKLFLLHSTFLDNMFLDEDYKDRLVNVHSHDPNNYRVYVLGQWGKVVTGQEYYRSFKEKEHCGVTKIVNYTPLHITFDFNVVPYLAVSVWQIEKMGNVWEVRGIGELPLKHPHNSTEDACFEILDRYGDLGLGFVIYGDATGRARKTSSKKTDYMIIEQILGHNIIEMRVPRSNPLPQDVREFMNRMFFGIFPIKPIIHPEMKYLLQDLTHILEDGERRKVKALGKDPVSKQTIEKYGHFSDGMDYMFCEVFKDFMI